MLKRALITCLAGGLLALGLAGPAQAGTYTQYTCKLPDGSPAGTDGWVADGGGGGFTLPNRCAAGEALSIEMMRGLPVGSQRRWQWTAPTNTTLQALTVHRAFRLADGDTIASPTVKTLVGPLTFENAGSWTGEPSRGELIPWNHASNRITGADNPLLAANELTITLACLGDDGASCPAAGASTNQLHLHSAAFDLKDDSAPSVVAIAGPLTSPDAKQGIATLNLSATDTGSGVYRTILSVDGSPISSSTPDSNGGRCADVVPSDPKREFQHRVPCPLSVSGAPVSLDTRSLSDGHHVVHVEVEDASGNRTSAFGPSVVEVRNAATPGGGTTPPSAGTATPTAINGAGGGTGARLSVVVIQSNKRSVRVPYGKSVTLSGRLVTQAGAPVSHAVVDVLAQTRARGARMTALGQVRTDAAGGFRYVVKAGPSRVVRFGYRARIGDTAFAHTTDVDVRVKAKVSMKPSRTRLRNGNTLTYVGRVSGQRTARPLVQIQVVNRGRWVNVCVVRARTNGAYSCRYRFRRTFRPTSYVFRALVRSQDGLPYETASSPRVSVRVRP